MRKPDAEIQKTIYIAGHEAIIFAEVSPASRLKDYVIFTDEMHRVCPCYRAVVTLWIEDSPTRARQVQLIIVYFESKTKALKWAKSAIDEIQIKETIILKEKQSAKEK